MKIKIGAVVTTVVALGAMIGVIAVFMKNASPYVTVAEAKTSTGTSLHLLGDIIPTTVQNDVRHRRLEFDLVDTTGQKMHVVHVGEPPANMGDATRVVAIGGMTTAGDFRSERMLVKCPTKYKGEEKPAPLTQ